MRTTPKSTVRGAAVSVSIWLSVTSVFAQVGESAFYVVDGARVELAPSTRYLALEVDQDAEPEFGAQFSADIRDADIGNVDSVSILDRYGIVLIQANQRATPDELSSAMSSFSRRTGITGALPVFTVGDTDAILINEFIVQFAPEVSDDDAQSILEDAGAGIIEQIEQIEGRFVIRFEEIEDPLEALAASNNLHQTGEVEFSEPNLIQIIPTGPEVRGEATDSIEPGPSTATPNDPLFQQQWGLNNAGMTGVADADINALSAWSVSIDANEIVIAIVDEGVDIRHPDLAPKIVDPYDATDGDDIQDPMPWDAHGTASAGIAAAVGDNGIGIAGVAWEPRIMPIRIAQSSCDGCSWITSSLIIEDGLRTAVDRGANILSNSWGGGTPSNAINSSIDHGIDEGAVFVFAAGNDSGAVSYPANLSSNRPIIAVSATNEWDEFKTTASQDGESWWGSNFGPEVSLSAPGVHIHTTDILGSDGYANGDYVANFNGTSSSTPFVAGAAALILAQDPDLGPSEVRSILQSSSDDLGPPGRDDRFGHGRLNVGRAVGGGKISSSGTAALGWMILLLE